MKCGAGATNVRDGMFPKKFRDGMLRANVRDDMLPACVAGAGLNPRNMPEPVDIEGAVRMLPEAAFRRLAPIMVLPRMPEPFTRPTFGLAGVPQNVS